MHEEPRIARMTVTVARPATWCFVPLDSPLVVDPDLSDSEPRWSTHPQGGWLDIAAAANEAVRLAQFRRRDPLRDRVTVEIPAPRYSEQRQIVEEWVSGGQAPQFGPAIGEVINGRHRTWNAKSAGAEFAPVVHVPTFDAVFGFFADADIYAIPGRSQLDAWREERAWWNTADALAWRRLNRSHLRLWDALLMRWQAKLDS